MSQLVNVADASAKSLECLRVTFNIEDVTGHRDVFPVGDASIKEVVAAMQEDWELRPVHRGGDSRIRT